MNEITSGIFIAITFLCFAFLVGTIFINDKIKALICGILSTMGFISLGQMILNGTVGVYYVVNSNILFKTIQSTTLHYFFLAVGTISLFLSVYLVYEIYMTFFSTKNLTAFPEDI